MVIMHTRIILIVHACIVTIVLHVTAEYLRLGSFSKQQPLTGKQAHGRVYENILEHTKNTLIHAQDKAKYANMAAEKLIEQLEHDFRHVWAKSGWLWKISQSAFGQHDDSSVDRCRLVVFDCLHTWY